MAQSNYRPDVDGLRAVAVLLVVLYHLNVPGFAGGFVGVDVFFVISGFVVTRTIAPRVRAGAFSFRQFYGRRFWRLAPAFFLVAALTIAGSARLLEGDDLTAAVTSALASASGSANLYFWATTESYAARVATQAPFLHMWSLAVEEQFYLLWPWLLVTGSRLPWLRRRVAWGALWLLALVVSELLARTHASFAYYWLPARAMELGLGAALVGTERASENGFGANVAALAGLSLVVGSAMVLDERSPFPGLVALFPCAGSALLIQAGSARTRVSKSLGSGPITALGRASYSWYLWHWPPIAWANYLGVSLTGPLRLALGGGTLLLALASFRWWETPTRRAPTPGYRVATFSLLALALVLGAGAAWKGSLAGAGEARVLEPGDEERRRDPASQRPWPDPKCLYAAEDWPQIDRCSGAHFSGGRRLLIWGDSHAAVYTRAILGAETPLGWTVTTIAAAGCPPLFGVFRRDPGGHDCTERTGEDVKAFIQHHRFDAILVAGRFGIYETGLHIDGKLDRDTHFLSDAETDARSAELSAQVFARHLASTIRELQALQPAPIVIALPTPLLPRWPRPSDLLTKTLGKSRSDYLGERRFFDGLVKNLPATVLTLDPVDALCDASFCPAVAQGGFLYRDDNHLIARGQKRLVPLLREVLRRCIENDVSPSSTPR